MVNLRKILITTDMSEHSLAAVDLAVSLRLLYDATLYILYVQEDLAPIGLALHTLYVDGDVYRKRSEAEAKVALDEFVDRHFSPHGRPVPVVRTGDPTTEINLFAEGEGVDLVVMATHGRAGVGHALMGSIAEKVVRTSRVPVLTVKPAPMQPELIREEDIERELHLR
jgi:nucleotide-binding universal stress UspA family protein